MPLALKSRIDHQADDIDGSLSILIEGKDQDVPDWGTLAEGKPENRLFVDISVRERLIDRCDKMGLVRANRQLPCIRMVLFRDWLKVHHMSSKYQARVSNPS